MNRIRFCSNVFKAVWNFHWFSIKIRKSFKRKFIENGWDYSLNKILAKQAINVQAKREVQTVINDIKNITLNLVRALDTNHDTSENHSRLSCSTNAINVPELNCNLLTRFKLVLILYGPAVSSKLFSYVFMAPWCWWLPDGVANVLTLTLAISQVFRNVHHFSIMALSCESNTVLRLFWSKERLWGLPSVVILPSFSYLRFECNFIEVNRLWTVIVFTNTCKLEFMQVFEINITSFKSISTSYSTL